MQLPLTMNAMVLDEPKKFLVSKIVPLPKRLTNQVLIRVIACGVCRTDLHIIDGELSHPKLPLIRDMKLWVLWHLQVTTNKLKGRRSCRGALAWLHVRKM
jgi:hypothetical protein